MPRRLLTRRRILIAMETKAQPIGSVVDWCRSHPVRRGGLYGSRARGEEGPDSDVDLALWTAPLPAPAERLAQRLQGPSES